MTSIGRDGGCRVGLAFVLICVVAATSFCHGQQAGTDTTEQADTGDAVVNLTSPSPILNLDVDEQRRITCDIRNAPLREVAALLGSELDLEILALGDASVPVSLRLQKVPPAECVYRLARAADGFSAESPGVYRLYLPPPPATQPEEPSGCGRDEVMEPVYVCGRSLKFVPVSVSPVEADPSGYGWYDGRSGEEEWWAPGDVGDLPDVRRVKSQNVLIIRGTIEQIDHMLDRVDAVDCEVPGVLIEAMVTEFDVGRARSEGARIIKASSGNFRDVVIDVLNNVTGLVTGVFDTTAEYDDGKRIQAAIDFLVSNDIARILTNPHVTARSGEECRIRVSKDRHIFLSNVSEQTGAEWGVETIDAPVELVITPIVAPGKETVFLDVAGAIAEFGVIDVKTNTAEYMIHRNEFQAHVTVPHGDTTMIGDLRQSVESRMVKRVPLLGDLPIIGKLFRRDAKRVEDTHVVVFITPHLLPLSDIGDVLESVDREREAVPLGPDAPSRTTDYPARKDAKGEHPEQ